MLNRSNVAYAYDGTYNGFLCCVFESISRKEDPILILSQEIEQPSLIPPLWIETDMGHANRVAASIPKRMGLYAVEFLQKAFLTCLPSKEKHMLSFFRKGYQFGPSLMNMLTDDTVHTLHKAVLHLDGEAHLYCGFVRFSDYGGILAAEIEPKNKVLPILQPHFSDRFPNEAFLIFDKTHKSAVVHEKGRTEILPLEALELGSPSENERFFRNLWRTFYNTIGIEGRYNPRCRMNHMPKRYWGQLTEFMDDDNVDCKNLRLDAK